MWCVFCHGAGVAAYAVLRCRRNCRIHHHHFCAQQRHIKHWVNHSGAVYNCCFIKWPLITMIAFDWLVHRLLGWLAAWRALTLIDIYWWVIYRFLPVFLSAVRTRHSYGSWIHWSRFATSCGTTTDGSFSRRSHYFSSLFSSDSSSTICPDTWLRRCLVLRWWNR